MSLLEKFYLFMISLFFVLIHAQGFFFWDNVVQLSVPANFYYENNFKELFLPDEIATGHQTFAAYYLAVGWKFFGRSLLSSHLLMLPFVFGILYQFYQLISKFLINKDHIYLTLFLTVLDACLLSQLSLITFEIIHIFFFLWAINCFIENKKWTLMVAFSGLCLVSLRSTMSAIGLLLFAIYYEFLLNKNYKLKNLYPFIPGFFLFSLFLMTFYIEKGWIVHNTVSNRWPQSGQFASSKDVLRNTIVIGKNFLDFGRGFFIISVFIILFQFIKRKNFDKNYKVLLGIAVAQFTVFFFTTVIYRNSISIRYFLPVSIILSIFFFVWVFRNIKKKYLIISLCFVSLINGYFWQYPINIATAWDCTPAHWHYYGLRNKMNSFIKTTNIDENKVGTFFPNDNTFKMIDLNDEDYKFSDVDFENNQYILFSNIYNADDNSIKELSDYKRWELIKQFSKGNVFVSLYRKKE